MTQSELYELIRSLSYKTMGDAFDYAFYYEQSTRILHVVFQQSHQKADWRTNLNFLPKRRRVMADNKLYWVWLHGGYTRAWKSAEVQVMLDLMEEMMKWNPEKVEADGWSYGGGICTNFIISYNRYFKQKADVITFADAKTVARKKDVKVLLKLVNSVTNYAHLNDIVGRVVPFWHTLNRIYLGDKFSFIQLFNPWKWHQIYGHQELYK